jgi:hypothetical protein
MEWQFFVVFQVSLQELLKGGFRKFSLKRHVRFIFGVIHQQSSIIFTENLYLFSEMGVAPEVDLVELVLVDEVDGDVFEVIISSSVCPVGIRK